MASETDDKALATVLTETNVYLKEIAGVFASLKRGAKVASWAGGIILLLYPKLQALIAAIPPFPT